jgi:hypothetical protein
MEPRTLIEPTELEAQTLDRRVRTRNRQVSGTLVCQFEGVDGNTYVTIDKGRMSYTRLASQTEADR